MSYVARTAATFAHALSAMLPEGPVWPRDVGSTLQRSLLSLAEPVARWAQDCGLYLMREAFPPSANLMLADWERVLGLPEECVPVPTTFAERQAAVRDKLARRPGAQSRAYFVGIATRLGYHETSAPYQLPTELPVPAGEQLQTTITEFRPFMAGVSRCGDARWTIAPPAMRFTWLVNVPGRRLKWFRCGFGGGQAGRDSHLRIRRAEDLECLLRQLKPAHTQLIFSYTGT